MRTHALAGPILFLFLTTGCASTSTEGPATASCDGAGPQTPRDIDSPEGTNSSIFSLAPDSTQMNLCNLHFHGPAEHRAEDFSLEADPPPGFQCNARTSLATDELAPLADNHCRGVQPGDTIEVHWVFSSCDVAPGKGLDACLSDLCGNPNLRVETQVFLVVDDPGAIDFRELDYGGEVDGYHQPKRLPDDTGEPVRFLGSTTGPSFSERACSPLQVSWSVRPQCAKVDITSLNAWCADNVFKEDYAHGVRALVTNPRLLSKIGKSGM